MSLITEELSKNDHARHKEAKKQDGFVTTTKTIFSQMVENSRWILTILGLMVIVIAAVSAYQSRQATQSQDAWNAFYPAQKALTQLSETKKWGFEKLNTDQELSSVLPQFRKVWETYPKTPAAWQARSEIARFYVLHGEPEKALPLYEANISQSSAGSMDLLLSHLAMASVLEQMGRCSDAKPHFEKSFNTTQNTLKSLAQEGLDRCAKHTQQK